MKYAISYILILSFFSFQFSETLVFISFKINQDYIAKNLCVEKDVEDSTCKGCCQLKKKLENQKDQKDQLPPTQNSKYNVDFFAQDINRISLFLPLLEITKSAFVIQFYNLFEFQVFHPPRKLS